MKLIKRILTLFVISCFVVSCTTKKSEQVFTKIMNSYSSKEIGILLNKSEKAIEYSRKNIRLKLGVDGTTPIDVFVRQALKTLDD